MNFLYFCSFAVISAKLFSFLLFFSSFGTIISISRLSSNNRIRRAAYDLPAGIEEQLGLTEVKKTFKCESDGYFADVDNDCKLFHICHSPVGNKNPKAITQSTMGCGIGQTFDQSKLTCNHESDSIPCETSKQFYYLNERIGNASADFLGPADIDRAKNARPEYKAKA